MIRKLMMQPFRIYNETTDELDANTDLFHGDPFRIYRDALSEGEILHWSDFIGHDKEGWPLYANDVIELEGAKYKAVYSKEFNSELIWLRLGGDVEYLADVKLINYTDLKEAKIDLDDYEKEEEEEEEDFKTDYGIPEFKVVDICLKQEVNEAYFGQSYDEMTNNVMYFRKCITPDVSESLFEMDVIEFVNYENISVYGVVLPYLPLCPILVDTSGELYHEFSLAIEGIDYTNLGNYFLLEDNLKNEIAVILSSHCDIIIKNPFLKED